MPRDLSKAFDIEYVREATKHLFWDVQVAKDVTFGGRNEANNSNKSDVKRNKHEHEREHEQEQEQEDQESVDFI